MSNQEFIPIHLNTGSAKFPFPKSSDPGSDLSVVGIGGVVRTSGNAKKASYALLLESLNPFSERWLRNTPSETH